MASAKSTIGGPLSDPPHSLTLRQYCLLAVVCFCFFLPGFFSLPVTDRDEARFVQASRQMLESGDFINISFQNQTRHKKPAGVYWLQSASTALLGDSSSDAVWTYRVPSLVGAVIAVLATAWLGAFLFGRVVGLSAALMLAGTLLLGVEARLAKTDASLLAAIVLAQAVLGRIYLQHNPERRAGWSPAMLFWLALGAAILIKGPVVFLFVGGTIAYLLATERQARWLLDLKPLPGVVLMSLVVLPWFVAIGIETDWAFFRSSLGHDFFAKLAKGQESHGAPPGFYFIAFWPTFWPFCLLAVLAVPWIWSRRRDPPVRFCIAWIVPAWIVLELVATKLPHYILPVFPAVAVLTAAAWRQQFEGGGQRLRKVAAFVAVTGFIICTVILAALPAVGPVLLDRSVNLWGFVPAAAGVAVLAYGLIWRRRGAWRGYAPVAGLLAGVWVFYGGLFQFFLPSLETVWLSERVADALRAHRPCAVSRLAASGFTEPSLVFLTGTDTRLGDASMVAQHLLDDPACGVGLIDQRAARQFLQHIAKAGRKAEVLASIDGVNYAKGKRLRLNFYRLHPDPMAR